VDGGQHLLPSLRDVMFKTNWALNTE
jgi:hypothetical protein